MHSKWQSIVPNTFTAPRQYKTNGFIFSPLGVNDIDQDYEAVMTSAIRLKGTFDFFPDWPTADLTKGEDLSNLGWHQTEFSMNTSFAYKITEEKNNNYVGCAYIFPSNNPDFEVDAYLWVKNSYEAVEAKLRQDFKQWLEKDWPFKKINFPGKTK